MQEAVQDKKTIVITPEKAKFYWDEYQFKEYNCILIAKTVQTIYDLVKHGIPMEELNIGGIAQKILIQIFSDEICLFK